MGEEVEYVQSLAVGLGATAGCATTEQMRKAIAAWYINIERAETPAASLALAGLQDAQKKVTVRLGNLQQQADSIAESGSVDDIFASLPLGSEGIGDEQVKSSWTLEDVGNLNTADKMMKRLKNASWKTLAPVLVCVLLTLLPYVSLVFGTLVQVIVQERTGECERDLKLPLTGWVITEFAFWGFALFSYCPCVEKHSDSIKKISGSAIGVARLFVVIMGLIATTQSRRRHCNNALYDLSTFLFVYAPIIIVALLCCGPLVTGCCVLLPSLSSATTADQQIAGRNV